MNFKDVIHNASFIASTELMSELGHNEKGDSLPNHLRLLMDSMLLFRLILVCEGYKSLNGVEMDTWETCIGLRDLKWYELCSAQNLDRIAFLDGRYE